MPFIGILRNVHFFHTFCKLWLLICSLTQSVMSSEDISKLHAPEGPSLADQIALTIGEMYHDISCVSFAFYIIFTFA